MTTPEKTPEQDYVDMAFMMGQVIGLLSKHRDRPDIITPIYSMMQAGLEHGIEFGRFDAPPSPAKPPEPTAAMINAVLDAQEEASHLFFRRGLNHEYLVCRLASADGDPDGEDGITVLSQHDTKELAENAWRRAKAAHIARALLSTPIAPKEPNHG